MNDYEILLMLDPESPEARHDEIIARTRELVEAGGGAWLSHDAWGRRRLAYEIDHKTDGVYHLLQFDAEPATLDEVTRVLKITDGVMRHLATRRPKGGTRAAPPPLPPMEPEATYERPPRESSVGARLQPGTDSVSPETDVEARASEEYAARTEPEPEPQPESASEPEPEPEGGA